jgi:hypothetical protein
MRKILISLLLLSGSAAYAQKFQGPLSSQAQGNRESTRWTIADWLTQRGNMRLMDQWLATNRSANLFEFYLGGGPVSYTYKTGSGGATASTSQKSTAYQAAFYVSIFGIQGEYETTDHDLTSASGSLAVRLIGASHQGTNLTVKYGIRKLTDASATPETEWSNQFAEGDMTVYIVKMFGLKAQYRHYFPDTADNGVDLRGNRATAGAFVDIGLLRLYGDYFQEKMDADNGGTVTSREREGWEYGARLYF